MSFLLFRNAKGANLLYEAGKAADYAILILQGRARVLVSKDCLVFMAGPFMFFGEAILSGKLRFAELWSCIRWWCSISVKEVGTFCRMWAIYGDSDKKDKSKKSQIVGGPCAVTR